MGADRQTSDRSQDVDLQQPCAHRRIGMVEKPTRTQSTLVIINRRRTSDTRPNKECVLFLADMLPTSSKLRAVLESIITVPFTCVYLIISEQAAKRVLRRSSACLNNALAADSA